MDAFFASVEQDDNPHLKGKPLAVGGRPDSRGVVAAASYEARRFGVHSAMPMSRAVRLCPELQIVRPRHPRYQEVSRQIMDIFREYTDLVEPLSVDECFLDVTENHMGMAYATDIAMELKHRVKEATRLTASAGVAPNKFVAKIASDMQKPDGLTVVKPHQVRKFLNPLPVEKIWGVGEVSAKKLHKLGINTIGQMAHASEELLTSHFGKAGAHFAKLSRGEDERLVQPHRVRKSISQEQTFSTDIIDLEELKLHLKGQAEKVAEILRKKDKISFTVTLKVRYADFRTVTRSRTYAMPVTTADHILSASYELLDKTDAGKTPVRLIGIGVSKLSFPESSSQMLLISQ